MGKISVSTDSTGLGMGFVYETWSSMELLKSLNIRRQILAQVPDVVFLRVDF